MHSVWESPVNLLSGRQAATGLFLGLPLLGDVLNPPTPFGAAINHARAFITNSQTHGSRRTNKDGRSREGFASGERDRL